MYKRYSNHPDMNLCVVVIMQLSKRHRDDGDESLIASWSKQFLSRLTLHLSVDLRG